MCPMRPQSGPQNDTHEIQKKKIRTKTAISDFVSVNHISTENSFYFNNRIRVLTNIDGSFNKWASSE